MAKKVETNAGTTKSAYKDQELAGDDVISKIKELTVKWLKQA